jgi:hypothetical protein
LHSGGDAPETAGDGILAVGHGRAGIGLGENAGGGDDRYCRSPLWFRPF